MGLDQYIEAVGPNVDPEAEREKDYFADFEIIDVFYWRKNWDLHNVLAKKWLSLPCNKGRGEKDFNSAYLLMTPEIIEEVVGDNTKFQFPHDLKHRIEKLMSEGFKVYYTANW